MSQESKSNVQKALYYLMNKTGLKEIDIVRNTGVPQTTLTLIISGATAYPRIDNAYKIAKFFDVPLEFLATADLNLLHGDRGKQEILEKPTKVSLSLIPLIRWEQIKIWLLKGKETLSGDTSFFPVRDVSEKTFALKSMSFMKSHFPVKNAIIIIDPMINFSTDNSFLLISINSNQPTIRQVVQDGKDYYLYSLNKEKDCVLFDPKIHLVLGQIVETRINNKNESL